MRSLFLPLLVLVTACGYRFDSQDEDQQPVAAVHTVTVPYVKGDAEGKFTSELIRELSRSGYFACVQSGGELVLNAVIVSDNADRIGYRYDRHGPTGRLRHRLIGTENRRELVVEISLINSRTETFVVEPTKVVAQAEYDYIDPESIKELIFINSAGVPERTITFSLGQLDSIEGAQDDSAIPLYRHMAQRIVDGLIHLNI